MWLTCSGFEAAVFMPSGTMAQQIALRIHADRTNNAAVALHPTSHLTRHEGRAHEWLHSLRTIDLGNPVTPWTLDDVGELHQPIGAVLMELPLCELGGILPPWETVTALAETVHDRDAALHLDGARLWEAAAGYGRPSAEVAAHFDSAYLSFYKGIGAIAGAALLGDAELVATARVWMKRHGGRLISLWPYAASALHGLDTRLGRMDSYLDVARQVAKGLSGIEGIEGIEVVPEVPDTSMMHLHLEVTYEAFAQASMDVAQSQGIATWRNSFPTIRPRWQVVELVVGDATVDMGATAVVRAVTEVVRLARS